MSAFGTNGLNEFFPKHFFAEFLPNLEEEYPYRPPNSSNSL